MSALSALLPSRWREHEANVVGIAKSRAQEWGEIEIRYNRPDLLTFFFALGHVAWGGEVIIGDGIDERNCDWHYRAGWGIFDSDAA
ncbi:MULTISPECIES: hypothetical protein [unclassified Paraburkholderia]|uniref:hypothetical protein n=1 Tax=unclassified Paraburkholderia TaxID=2615204 RepID=UPI001622C695|nr:MULTISPECIES: hypothetical protein [unclassified Paraburkholderia]MBB5445169.1 hypothetical protein [Paraburkholderia sp. WSM4177]MBB5485717.1 hypothetical protein [Paraburkholderia sp. WSM4180]